MNDRIVRIETYRWPDEPRQLWVEVTTADGIVGLGETHYIPEAVEAVIHHFSAPLLLGQRAADIERHWANQFACINFYGSAGAEMRAVSAVDIALWDIAGQRLQQPVYELLGGKVRDEIPVYNTCVNGRHHQDLARTLTDAGELAAELLDSGIRAMKIFPWDRYAPKVAVNNGGSAPSMGPMGSWLHADDVREGLQIVEHIRKAVGDRMEIMIEGHASWDLAHALKIARALEPYGICWMEDMMQPNNPDDLRRLSAECRVPQAVSERLLSRHPLRQVLERGAAHIVMTDLVWTGGITEAKKIASLADTYQLPIAPHDCVGPVNVFAGMHICANAVNAMVMETARAFYDRGYYSEVVTRPVVVDRGRIVFPDTPGLGTALSPEFKRRSDVLSRASVR